MPFSALVYPSSEGGRGASVTGLGHLALLLEPRADSQHLAVRIEDIALKLDPARIPFDIDRDGRLECLELEGIALGPEDFDLEKSGGRYDPKSGALAVSFVFTLHPRTLKLLGADPGLSPLRFEVREQGWLDVERGIFATHSAQLVVPDGPLAGLTVLGGQGEGTINGGCSASVALGVAVLSAGPAAIDIPAGQAPTEVWICPRASVVLLWDSSNCDNVDIQPDLGVRPTSGHQVIPDPASTNADLRRAIDRNTVYTADTVGGGCYPAHDQVKINVVEDGDEVPQSASYNREFNYWVAYLPDHTYDHSSKVDQVIVDTTKADSVTHPSWRLDHLRAGEAPVGTTIPAVNAWANTPAAFSLPGEYRFTPQPPGVAVPSGDQQKTLYFRLKLRCSL